MAVRRISDLPYLYTAYPDASLSDSLMEISYTPGNSIYQSFCQDISSVMRRFNITEDMLPRATTNNYGVVKIGNNIEVNNGIISVNEAEEYTNIESKMGIWYKPPANLSCVGTDQFGHFVQGDIAIKIQNIVTTNYAIIDCAYPIGSLYMRAGDNLAPPGVDTQIGKSNIASYATEVLSGAICIEEEDDRKFKTGHMQWRLLPQNMSPWSTWQSTEINTSLSAYLPSIKLDASLSGKTNSGGSHMHYIRDQIFTMRPTGGVNAGGPGIGPKGTYWTDTDGSHTHDINVSYSIESQSKNTVYNKDSTSKVVRPTSYGVVIWQRIEDVIYDSPIPT